MAAEKSKFQKIRDFAVANPDVLFIAASPLTDEVYMEFNKQEAIYKFPETGDIANNIIFQLLNKGTFHVAIDAFLTAIMKGLGLKEKSVKKVKDKSTASFLGLIDGFVFNSIGMGDTTGKVVSPKVDKKRPSKKK